VPGFEGPKRELTIRLVRVLFPGVGILVLSAWCLGVLNSHGRFFLSYAAPVIWNVAIVVTTLAAAGRGSPEDLTVLIAWGAVAGSLLQVAVQWPGVRLVLASQPTDRTSRGEVRTVVRNFGPAVVSRGVVQLSGWLDMLIASLLGTGAASALANAQLISTLPVSLFGMSVSASELPAMAAEGHQDDGGARLRQRLEAGWHRSAFYVVPSAVAFLALGQVVAATILQGGAFTAADSDYLWLILAGASLGLLATTMARLASSAFFALGDTRTPSRVAAVRMVVGVGLGLVFALVLPARLGLEAQSGVAGLTLAGGVAGWLEFWLLRRALERRIGPARIGAPYLVTLWACALGAAVLGWGLLTVTPVGWPAWMRGIGVLGGFGVGYLCLAWTVGVAEARTLVSGGRPRAG